MELKKRNLKVGLDFKRTTFRYSTCEYTEQHERNTFFYTYLERDSLS
jgi:hypothetical protein